ncbi:CcmD family protein [Mucilaginibacter pocheonensis]|uniref:CcmD family protein n=1 Tax=Mucilaginibacter pocheonensis TaxID=398050 RepID=A0ABU1TH42_9SPHI|nr:CcmD family protein [Mucilaginibacter pocheonensis]MDR6944624.1 CcmD family protein [Mucilaginibacter pocheonensis]
MKKFTVLLLLVLSFVTAFAQQTQSVEMADVLRSSGKIYVVVATIVIIFAGLAFYLFSIDKRLKKIEKEK